MLDWLRQNSPTSDSTSNSTQSSAVVRVIGDRAAGKTTYMASLARWPNADSNSPVQSVIPINDDGEELVEQARNILEQGLVLEPTRLNAKVSEVKDYSLSIALKEQFTQRKTGLNRQPSLLTLNVNCKDYAGEFFSDVLYQTGDPKLKDYLEDCLEATGIMFLVDGISNRKDAEYANGLKTLLTKLDRTMLGSQKRRIALVLTKCEQSELWVNRHRPTFLASARFPLVYKELRVWQEKEAGSIDCFTTSAFGMLGTHYPKPNAERLSRGQRGVTSVIKDPKRWKPFGLVAPIYWLCTGNRHQELDKD